MDGICRSAGGRVDITLCRLFFWLRPLTLGDFGVAEYWLLARRKNPVELAEEKFRAFPHLREARQELMDSAAWEMRTDRSYRLIHSSDLMEWLYSDDGLTFIMLRCLERTPGKPCFTSLEQCRAIFKRLTPDEVAELKRRVNMVSGLDLMASMDWPESRSEPSGRLIPWRKLYRSFAERFHWDADQVDRLTLYQMRVYTVEETALGGTSRMQAKEAMEFMRKKREFGRHVRRSDPKDTPARRDARKRIAEQFAAKKAK